MCKYLLTSDWHVREDQPICRTDDYYKIQWEKIDWIISTAFEKKVDSIIHAGDLFHKAKPSLALVNKTVRTLKSLIGPNELEINVLPGNHDLINNNWDLLGNTGLYNLDQSGISYLSICSGEYFETHKKIKVLHQLICHNDKIMEKAGGTEATKIVKKYHEEGFKLVLTGDNHQTFEVKYKDTWLLNPGSMTRMTAAQARHKPCVYIWDDETNEFEKIFIPIKRGVINRDYITKEKEKDERIESFVSNLSDNFEIGLSYENNLKEFFGTNKTDDRVKTIIHESMEN